MATTFSLEQLNLLVQSLEENKVKLEQKLESSNNRISKEIDQNEKLLEIVRELRTEKEVQP